MANASSKSVPTSPTNTASLIGAVPPSHAVFYLLLVLTATVMLVLGLALPTIELKELVFKKNTFSILAGIQALVQEKYYFLALIIFVFSIIFPIVKLGILAGSWLLPMTARARQTWIQYLEITGKWSMLDVFVVALMIIITRTSGLIKARPLPGIYWFAGSVILAMLASSYLKQLHNKAKT